MLRVLIILIFSLLNACQQHDGLIKKNTVDKGLQLSDVSNEPRQCWEGALFNADAGKVWLLATAANTGKLKYANSDARQFVQGMQELLNIPESQICLLTQARKDEIEQAFINLAKVPANDLVIFYYSGHGSKIIDLNSDERQRNAGDYWDEIFITADFNPEQNIVMRDDDFSAWVNALKTDQFVAVLDACYSPELLRNNNTKLTSKFFIFDWFRDKHQEPVVTHLGGIEAVKGLLLSATDKAQDAYEDKDQGGVFTKIFLRSLGKINPQKLSFSSWFTNISQQVQKQTNYKQTPKYTGNKAIWLDWLNVD